MDKNARRKIATENLGMETNAEEDKGKAKKEFEYLYWRSNAQERNERKRL